jgi:hypothetical protein
VGSDDGRTSLLADAVDLALDGETARLGRLLAPMGVRYIVVPDRLAPAPFAAADLPVAADLLTTLDAQLDLEPLDVPAGLHVYRNQAVAPIRSAYASAPDTSGGISGAASLDLTGARAVLPDEDGALSWSGPLEAGATVLFAAAHSDHWTLTVDGDEVEHTKSFDWANQFTATDGGEGHLHYATPVLRYGLVAAQALVWLVALRQLVKRPVRRPELEVVS